MDLVIPITHCLLEQCPFPLLARQPGAIEVGRACDYLADLGERRRVGSQGLLLLFRVQDVAHAQDLPVSLEFGRQIGLWEIEPVGTCALLISCQRAVYTWAACSAESCVKIYRAW